MTLLAWLEEYGHHNPGATEHQQGKCDGLRLAAAELRGLIAPSRSRPVLGDATRQLPMVAILDALEPISFFATQTSPFHHQ